MALLAVGHGQLPFALIRFWYSAGLREENLESCPAAHFAMHLDVAVTLLHNAVNGRQPHSGAFSFFLCGEERFEDSGVRFGIHADSVIRDSEEHVASGFDG